MTEKRPLTANDLYQLRLVSDAQVAPDGRCVAFVLRQMVASENDYRSNIYLVDRQGTVRQFTSGNRDSAPRWSPDGQQLAYLSARDGSAQLRLISADGGESVPLTALEHDAGVPRWSPDGRCIAFAGETSFSPPGAPPANGESAIAPTKVVERASYKADGAGYVGNKRRHIFVIDVNQRTVRQLTDGDFMDDDPAWSPDSRCVAFGTNRDERWDVSPNGDIYLVSRSGGDARAIVEGGAYSRPAFSKDGSRILFLGHRDPDDVFAPARVYSAALDGSDLRDEIGEWDGSVGNEILSDVVRPHDDYGQYLVAQPEGTLFIGSVRGEANLYCASAGSVAQVTAESRTISDFSVASDGTIAYIASSSTCPAEVFLVENGTSLQLTHENRALLDEVHIVQPERFQFTAEDGEPNDGWLLPPIGHEDGTYPLLTYVHGGPHLAHGEVFFFEYQMLASQGFGVFYPNIHGSSSYGRAYQVSIHGDWGNRDFHDVVAGTRAAAERSWVDPQRLGIVGGSYGGYMTIWALGHSDLFRAGVTDRCVSNLLSFFGTSDSGWVWNRAFGVYPEEDAQRLWSMSPIQYVSNITAPLLVIQYEGDDRTPLEQGEQVFVALRRLGKETGFVIIPEESHGLSRKGKPSRRIERIEHTLNWFKRYL